MAASLSPTVRGPRRVHRPVPQLNAEQTRILGWMEQHASLQAAAQLSDVPFCRVLSWVDSAREFPGGPCGRFARLVQELEPEREAIPTMTGTFGLARNGSGHFGNGNGSNGQHSPQLTIFEDL
jgi:hypothetical protein